jgi:multiple sugar transport system substrate-binding protein
MRRWFQAGGIDLILGDVIWPAQFAVNGWVLDLTVRFKDGQLNAHCERSLRVRDQT